MHIYTDSSKIKMDDVAGASVYYEHFVHYLCLGTYKSAFDGEVEAVKIALEH